MPLDVIERLFAARKRFERFAWLYVRDAVLSQDIVMESFAYLLEHRSEIDFSGNVEAYTMNIVKHKCLDHLSHMSVRRNAEETLEADARWEFEMNIATLRAFDPAWLYDSDVRRRISIAMSKLPEKTRRIFLMSRMQGMSYKEIASHENLSVKSIEFHISKALRRLRADLNEDFVILLVLLASQVHGAVG